MSVNVIDQIAPKNYGDFPVTEDVYLKGGWQVLPNLTARDSIPAQRRKAGMRCRVVSGGKTYELRGGIDNANWTEVFEGSIVDAFVDQTTGNTTMSVDAATGTSPPAGTIIHNQAEYDALGAPLKYVQDAIDILPIGIAHAVLVNLAAGAHLAKADNSGFPGWSLGLMLKPFKYVDNGKFDVSSAWYLAGIQIRGAAFTVVHAAVAGTSTLYGFTRDSGTWTAHALKGKFASVTDGSGAGQIFVIIDNTTTALTLQGSNWAPGTCSMEIDDPSSVLLCSTDGINPDVGWGIYIPHGGYEVPIMLSMVQLGTQALPWGAVGQWDKSSFVFQQSRIWFGNWWRVEANADASFLARVCDFEGSSYVGFRGASSYGKLIGIRFHNGIGLVQLPLSDRALVDLTDCTFDVSDLGVSGSVCVRCEGSHIDSSGGGNIILGDGANYGIRCGGRWGNDTYFYYPEFQFFNCGMAIFVAACTLHIQGHDRFIGSSGNAVGWGISSAADVICEDFSHIGATAAIYLDGHYFDYSDIGAGETLVGRYGSAMRQVTF
jgi:hypothetical protein